MQDSTVAESRCSSPGCINVLPSMRTADPSSKAPKWVRHYGQIGKDEIRLVRLKPGGLQDVLRCDLFTVQLFKSPSLQEWKKGDHSGSNPAKDVSAKFLWRALSYVWGSAAVDESSWHRMKRFFRIDKPRHIYVNGDKMPVQSNLYDCLVWLRYHRYLAPIWIDALCINQVNSIEKSDQVQKMGDIYRSSGETLICVPPLIPNEYAQDLLRRQAAVSDLFRDQEPIVEETMIEVLTELIANTETQLLYKAIANMMNNSSPSSYWNRMWTFQECVLSRTLTVISGTLVMSWERLLEIRGAAMIAFIRGAIGVPNDEMYNAQSAAALGQKMRGLICVVADQRHRLRMNEKQVSIEHILRESSPRLYCTDPRDNIYGILGMAQTSSNQNFGIRSDYSRCAECVWQEAAVLIIRETNSLSILALCGSYSDTSKRQLKLPSWIPYWNEIPSTIEKQDDYQFCKDTTARFKFSADLKSLEATGFIMGTVNAQSTLTSIESYDQSEVEQELSRISAFLSTVIINEEDRVRCFENLASLAIESYAKDPSFEDIATNIRRLCLSHATSRSVAPPDPDVRLGVAFSSMAMVLWQGYPVVFEDKGTRPKLAVGYSSHITKGDVICGILGCNTPLVIRRESDGDHIIGFCLIGGYHHGEVMDELKEGRFDETTFRFV